MFLSWVEPGDEFVNEEPVEYAYEDQAFDNSENLAGKMTIPSNSENLSTMWNLCRPTHKGEEEGGQGAKEATVGVHVEGARQVDVAAARSFDKSGDNYRLDGFDLDDPAIPYPTIRLDNR